MRGQQSVVNEPPFALLPASSGGQTVGTEVPALCGTHGGEDVVAGYRREAPRLKRC
jgi:hypothetical protein